MKSTLMIKDLTSDKELDRKAMAAVRGGNGMGAASSSALTSPTANITPSYFGRPTPENVPWLGGNGMGSAGLSGSTGNVTSSAGSSPITTRDTQTMWNLMENLSNVTNGSPDW
jgi:hypothetical protein